MNHGGRPVRTFVALELPEATRQRLSALSARLATASPEVRWLPVEALHLTLVFLGETEAARLELVRSRLAAVAAASAPFELALAGGGAFPSERRPRVVWVGCSRGRSSVQRLAHATSRSLATAVPFEPDAQPFRPHVTLGRLRRAGDTAAALSILRDFEAPPEPVAAIELVASQLGAGGSRYTTLEHCPLGSVARPGA